jgi:hypothetical protein
MTKPELELLHDIAATGTSFAPESTGESDRQAFRLVVQRVRSLVVQGLVVADFLMSKHALDTDPLGVYCSLTELGQLALAAERLMPATISYTVDHETRTVRVTARGVVGASDHEAHVRGLAAAGLFGYQRLEDYREAFVEGTRDEMRRMLGVVQELRRTHRPARTAFVTMNDMFYGMLRMYEALHAEDGHQFRVFLDRLEAEAWIRGEAPSWPPVPRGTTDDM